MPGAAHIFVGIVVGIFTWYTTRGKFTPYHVVVFTLNNILGPDLFWLIPNLEIADFFNTIFGYSMIAFAMSIPYFYIGKAVSEPIRYIDVYKLAVAGGISHVGIDGLGHVLYGTHVSDNFWLFSFDWVDIFIVNPAGLAIFLIVIGGIVIVSFLAFRHLIHRHDVKPSAAAFRVVEVILPAIVLFGSIALLKLMPFGDGKWFTIGDAVVSTSVGQPNEGVWITISGVTVAIVFCLLYKKRSSLFRLVIITGYAAVLVILLLSWPFLGGGEGDAGIIYFSLIFILVPLWLIATSFRRQNSIFSMILEKKEGGAEKNVTVKASSPEIHGSHKPSP
nr:hypothetical protein [Candidatus Sigynarchaeota archaeon]